MSPSPTVAIAAPYPEGAAMELATRWHSSGSLEVLIRPSRAVNRMAGHAVGRLSPGVSARVGRQSSPEQWIQELTPHVEVVRLGSKLLPVPSAFIHGIVAGKHIFDQAVARRGRVGEARVLIGMAEASLHVFRRYRQSCRVLHQVDAHPAYHNEVLENVYGKRRARAELYSRKRVAHMEAELELADRVLVPSRGVREQMRDHRVPEEKVITVPYGVDYDKFFPVPAAGAPGRTSRQPKALYVGQISLRKGIPFLIEAAGRTGVALDLIGPRVPGTSLPSLPDNVRYLGTMPHGQLAGHLNRADAFVFPSLEDSFAFTPVEAAASGLPLVMTRSVGAGELFEEASVRWVNDADVDDLADSLREIRPLSSDERMARAEQMRSGALCRVTSWAEYASTVYARLREASEHDD